MIFLILLDVNECESSPCKNNGSCVDGVGSYTCVCSQGYIGEECEIGNTNFPYKEL